MAKQEDKGKAAGARSRAKNRSKSEIAKERLTAEQARLDKAIAKQASLREQAEGLTKQIEQRKRRVEFLRADPDLASEPVTAETAV